MQPIISKHLLIHMNRAGIIVFVILLFIRFQPNANSQSSPIICENDTLICKADDLLISDLEDQLYQECGIRISGLKAQADQRITYEVSGPILEAIKRLLRYLQAESYVFEFNGDQLSHVLIYSRGKTRYRRPGSNYSQSKNKGKQINAVKVLDIVPGSQAEVHGFQKSDIIVEYDSVPIKSASQLVSEVKKKKKNKQRVELVLVRNGSRQSYVLNSGLIGVRIQTVRVSPDDIN
jgi:C-terminal processing protease CtpA/Prc